MKCKTRAVKTMPPGQGRERLPATTMGPRDCGFPSRALAGLALPFLIGGASLLIAACASKQVDYSPTIQSATDFTKKVVVELSGGLDKGLSPALNGNATEKDGLRSFTSDFYPRHGRAAVTTSFESYCNGIGGEKLVDGWCLPKDQEKPGFHLSIENLYTSVAGATSVRVKVVEPASANPADLRRFGDLYAAFQNERAAERRAAADKVVQREAEALQERERYRRELGEKRQAKMDWEVRSVPMRQGLKIGDSVTVLIGNSNSEHIVVPVSGLVIEVKRPIAYVQLANFSPSMKWIELSNLYAPPPPSILRCSRSSTELCLPR